jgi:hypothetical protein
LHEKAVAHTRQSAAEACTCAAVEPLCPFGTKLCPKAAKLALIGQISELPHWKRLLLVALRREAIGFVQKTARLVVAQEV